MAKYLVVASYSAEGMKGVISKGGSARVEAVSKMIADLGGTVESFYFAFGDDDAYVTVDLPDNVAAAAIGMAVGASGMASVGFRRTLLPGQPALPCRSVSRCYRTVVPKTPTDDERAPPGRNHLDAPGRPYPAPSD